jgi:hypothetical protein
MFFAEINLNMYMPRTSISRSIQLTISPVAYSFSGSGTADISLVLVGLRQPFWPMDVPNIHHLELP